MSTVRKILELPKRLDMASSLLRENVGSTIERIKRSLSDRDRFQHNVWRVESIDEKLKTARSLLEALSAHRPKALGAQRLLITQSISITESEKATTENHAVVVLEERIRF